MLHCEEEVQEMDLNALPFLDYSNAKIQVVTQNTYHSSDQK